MEFGGSLSVLEPSILFQIMSLSGLDGELKLITSDNVASFHFREGALTYATIDTRKKKLGEFLVERSLITEDQLATVLREFKSRGRGDRLGSILISRGYLDRDSLVSALQEQMKEVVYEVLAWRSGEFAFFKGRHPQDEDILLDVKLDSLILEGLKRLDESKDPER